MRVAAGDLVLAIMQTPFPRPGPDKAGGPVMLGRTLDKIRLHQAGRTVRISRRRPTSTMWTKREYNE